MPPAPVYVGVSVVAGWAPLTCPLVLTGTLFEFELENPFCCRCGDTGDVVLPRILNIASRNCQVCYEQQINYNSMTVLKILTKCSMMVSVIWWLHSLSISEGAGTCPRSSSRSVGGS